MSIYLLDGAAKHAKWLIAVVAGPTSILEKGVRGNKPEWKMLPFRVVEDKIVCFDDRELSRAEVWLKDRGIKYEIEKLSAPANWDLTEGVRYSSIEEVRAHLEQGIEPESMVVPQLRARLAVAEAKAARVDELEARLRTLEDAEEKAAEGKEEGEGEREEREKEEKAT